MQVQAQSLRLFVEIVGGGGKGGNDGGINVYTVE
jgi:hypothetical protein